MKQITKQDDEVPLLDAITLFCWIAVLALLVLSVFVSKRVEMKPQNELEYRNTEQSVLYAWESPVLHYQVLGCMTGDLIDRIIFCESSGNPKAKNPRSSAHGLCQFISSTKRYVEKKWDMTIDWDNPVDQLYACKRLYSEEGEKHWLESKECWDK